jgi:hypothetical protein
MAGVNHDFRLSETKIFFQTELDSSGKTGGGIFGGCPSGKDQKDPKPLSIVEITSPT